MLRCFHFILFALQNVHYDFYKQYILNVHKYLFLPFVKYKMKSIVVNYVLRWINKEKFTEINNQSKLPPCFKKTDVI